MAAPAAVAEMAVAEMAVAALPVAKVGGVGVATRPSGIATLPPTAGATPRGRQRCSRRIVSRSSKSRTGRALGTLGILGEHDTNWYQMVYSVSKH